ncbi:hypothetical protein [Micromonospora sp. NPDC006431]|uniref:hypothetical protein n=1 Tax=Micromonospora sp. NPDC006431 TaxID=3364235 RepID=UPI0036A9F0D9
MPKTRHEHDQESLRRRLEILQLPVSPLRHAGYLIPDQADRQWERVPETVGVGPDNHAFAVWASREQPRRRLITIHDGSRQPVRSVQLDGCIEPWFVQPLPGGRILLVRSRNRDGANAEVWTPDGHREHQGDLGDAIAHVLTTPGGAIWAGYFDEAMAGSGPQIHGLARFTTDLELDWLYPQRPAMPEIFDCYALNLADETAWICAYTQFHLVSVTGDTPTDHGRAPYRGAHALLTDGTIGALVRGYGPEYDLVGSVPDRCRSGGACR